MPTQNDRSSSQPQSDLALVREKAREILRIRREVRDKKQQVQQAA